jgi:hypothetical protein
MFYLTFHKGLKGGKGWVSTIFKVEGEIISIDSKTKSNWKAEKMDWLYLICHICIRD